MNISEAGGNKITNEEGKKTDERITKIIPLMCELKKKHVKGLDIVGEYICPECGGKMYYRVSGYNKHVWLKCATPDCITIIE